ncbi:MAG: HlyC/CorC family transporter [Phycisphaerales bacterium]|nr:HlyC/CorC family transporter [Phycisphaerales bacterium]
MSGLLLGVILLLIVLWATTANLVVRHFSRVDLTEHLEKKGKGHLVQRLMEHRNELLFLLPLVRLSAILGLILLIAHYFNLEPATDPSMTSTELGLKYLSIYLASMVLIVVFGVAVPNAWARYAGEEFLAFSIGPLLVLRWLLYPLAVFQHLVDGIVRRLAGVPNGDDEEDEADQIEKEILGVISEGEMSGAVHEEDADMLESVIELRDTNVGQIMTPRTEIFALPSTATLGEAKALILAEGHSRIPIYGDNIDDIKGVLYAKDLLNLDEHTLFDPLQLMRKVPFVPETKRVPDLLKELREKKVHLAIVLDEYGGTAGLVTIEDIIEEIVGEIEDEYETSEPEAIQRIDEQTVELDARVRIDEINDELKLDLPEDEDFDTVGGFIFSQMGKIPLIGEEFHFHNLTFRILDAEERKINRLLVVIAPAKTVA